MQLIYGNILVNRLFTSDMLRLSLGKLGSCIMQMSKEHAAKLATLIARDIKAKLYDPQLLGSLQRLLEHTASIIVEKPISVRYVERQQKGN